MSVIKRILVTGGAGFLGSHLCERLLCDGHEVICLDNFSSGSESNIASLRGNPAFTLLRQDVTSPIAHLRVDQIYNLACIASPVLYQRDPVHTLKTNVLGALHVLELALNSGARILQASTSEIYGDPLVHPQSENYNGNVSPTGPRACYVEGKRSAEALFADFHRQHGLSIKIVRIFNTYGPRMLPDDGRVVSSFFAKAMEGADLPIFGDGRQTRSFCYVDDMIDGLISMMESDTAIIGPLNLGNPHEISMLELAQRIIHLTHSASKLVFHPHPPDDPRQRRPDISEATRMLKWTPLVSLNDGLELTYSHYASTQDNTSDAGPDHHPHAGLRGRVGLSHTAA